jgi:DNA-binding response OmpR family regulator
MARHVPVIALVSDHSLCALETEGVEYHVGAPDFAELVTRVCGLLERPRPAKPKDSSKVIVAGDFLFELEARSVIRAGKARKLTPKAAQLLHAFVTHSGETLTRRWLMKEVWDTDYTGDTRTLDVHVRWIRVAIEHDPGSPEYLRTVRGVGYRFDAPRP